MSSAGSNGFFFQNPSPKIAVIWFLFCCLLFGQNAPIWGPPSPPHLSLSSSVSLSLSMHQLSPFLSTQTGMHWHTQARMHSHIDTHTNALKHTHCIHAHMRARTHARTHSHARTYAHSSASSNQVSLTYKSTHVQK